MIYFNFGKCRTCNVGSTEVIVSSKPVLMEIDPKHPLFLKKGQVSL